ncbi:MAG: hypothetical protein IJ523_07575 [Succinivibrionaceae bacterium]|nr:hypothetical protein [Succinivibrionaceae bacterium]
MGKTIEWKIAKNEGERQNAENDGARKIAGNGRERKILKKKHFQKDYDAIVNKLEKYLEKDNVFIIKNADFTYFQEKQFKMELYEINETLQFAEFFLQIDEIAMYEPGVKTENSKMLNCTNFNL